MIKITDHLAGDRITIYCPESKRDLFRAADFLLENEEAALDTESTGINCYRIDWKLRTFQFGNEHVSYVVPANYRKFIGWVMKQDVVWFMFNGPHDVRSIDHWLGYDTGVVGEELYIPGHYYDSRNEAEGGVGHGLKALATHFVDRDAGRWEKELKEAFKEIKVPIPGEVYKSSNKSTGVVKGQQKMRKIRLDEGWALIDPKHPAYLTYAGLDPILTKRLKPYLHPYVTQFPELYDFDQAVQQACDVLQRRAIRCYVTYTRRLSERYKRLADKKMAVAAKYGCENINSTDQLAATLLRLRVRLTETTETGKLKVDARIMREIKSDPHVSRRARHFVQTVLVAKQVLKRRASYTEAMLREMDDQFRVHPSINALAARTARMSVGSPPLQQLPTKDHEEELLEWESEELEYVA